MKDKAILIVEDEAMSALMLTVHLKKIGFSKCKMVSTAEEAISTAIKEKPEIIFMDINLSGEIDGIKAAQEILKEYNASVIFITGYSSKDIKEKAIKLRPTAYLEKPLFIDNIEKILNSI